MENKATATGNLDKMIELFGEEYVLRQCAEECMDLSRALLQLIRSVNGELRPETPAYALENVVDEIADATLLIAMVREVLKINIEDVMERMQKAVDDYAGRMAKLSDDPSVGSTEAPKTDKMDAKEVSE